MIAYSTDAPLYHRPVATVGLIVLQCLLFLSVPKPSEDPEPVLQMPAAGPRMIVPLGEDQPAERPQWDEADFADPVADDDGFDQSEEGLQPANPNPLPGLGQMFRSFEPRLQSGRLKPVQWITSPFVHLGLGQLIVNMFGLWALGLVIEGKVGPRRFLLIFLLLAISLAAIVQSFLWITGIDDRLWGGAEFAILGLLGVAIIWAPKNCFDVWFGPYIGTHEIPILVYGFLQAIISVIFLNSGSGAAAFLSLIVGACVGFIWLRRNWVDCEGWDLMSIWRNEHVDGKPSDRNDELEHEAQQLVEATRKYRETGIRPTLGGVKGKSSERISDKKSSRKPNRTQAGEKIDGPNKQGLAKRASRSAPQTHHAEDLAKLIDEQQYATALKLRAKLEQQGTPVQLSQPVLGQLMRGLLKSQNYAQAVEVMQEHIARFEESRSAVQLALCKTLLHMERPSRAMRILKSMDRDRLDESERAAWKRLYSHAKQQIDDGVIELSE